MPIKKEHKSLGAMIIVFAAFFWLCVDRLPFSGGLMRHLHLRDGMQGST